MIYEFKCENCGQVIQLDRTIEQRNDPVRKKDLAAAIVPADECILTGNHKFHRILSIPNVPFEHLMDQGVFERIKYKK